VSAIISSKGTSKLLLKCFFISKLNSFLDHPSIIDSLFNILLGFEIIFNKLIDDKLSLI